jgi:hypothetical protein
MATQPLYQPYTPPAAAMPDPNIRVALSNGVAAAAVERALANLPAEIPEVTLDELAIREQVRDVIAQAKPLLSKSMYAAFLEWGEAASLISTSGATNAESEAHLDALSDALDRVKATQPEGEHDAIFSGYLLSLEATDSSGFGPIREANADGEHRFVEGLARSTYNAAVSVSPIVAGLHHTMIDAWRLSNSTTALTPTIGKLITDTFTQAIIDDLETVVIETASGDLLIDPIASAGPAVIAMRNKLAGMLEAEQTLDELAIAEQTQFLIDEAATLLSPAMFSAFLEWGKAASHFSSEYVSDSEGARRLDRTAEALRQAAKVPVVNVHDYAFKEYLMALEMGYCRCFGPSSTADMDGGHLVVALAKGIAADRSWLSPLPGMLDELSQAAWNASPNNSSFAIGIGAGITSAFIAAIVRDRRQTRPVVTNTFPGVPVGYDPFMRGALIEWQRRYTWYEYTRENLRTFDREVHTPTFASKHVDDEVADAVQQQFDELLAAEHDAIARLYRVPAPSSVELAVKLKIFEEQDGWELAYAAEAVRLIAIDARRHGRLSAYRETDQPLRTEDRTLLDLRSANLHTAFVGRNALMETLNKEDHGLTKEDETVAYSRMSVFEDEVLDSPALSAGDVILKLLMAAHINAEGFEVPSATSSDMLREAQQYLGTCYSLNAAEQSGANLVSSSEEIR